jgi:hypothetical protein
MHAPAWIDVLLTAMIAAVFLAPLRSLSAEEIIAPPFASHDETPASAAAEPFCSEGTCDPWACFSLSADMLWLGRSKARLQPAILADVSGNAVPLVDVRDLLFNVEAGIRMESALRFPNGHWLDAGYSGIFDQTAAGSITVEASQIAGLNSVFYPFMGTTQGSSLSYAAEYQSDLHSLETNWGCWDESRIRPFAGIRWIRLAETYDITETTTPTSGATCDLANDLIGGQIGFHVGLWDQGDWFRVDSSFRAGVFQDRMDLYADVHNASGPLSVLDRSFTSTAYAGEIRVTAVLQFCSCASFQFGYTGLWLADVGLAPNQVDNFNLGTGQGTVDLAGVSYQGGHIGVELTW